MELTQLQQFVVDQVKEWGKDKPWFRGVCIEQEHFPTDKEIEEDLQGAIQTVCMSTAFWDAPDFFNP
jgi:hypothetical protein